MYQLLSESITGGLMILERPELVCSLILILVMGIFFKGIRWFPLVGLLAFGPSYIMLAVSKALFSLARACLVDIATIALVDYMDHYDAFLSQTSMHAAVYYCIDRQTCIWRWIPTNSHDIWSAVVRLTELCLSERRYTVRAVLVVGGIMVFVGLVDLVLFLLARKIARLVVAVVRRNGPLVTTAIRKMGRKSCAGFNVVFVAVRRACAPSSVDLHLVSSTFGQDVAEVNSKATKVDDASSASDTGVSDSEFEVVEEAKPLGIAPPVLDALSTLESESAKDSEDTGVVVKLALASDPSEMVLECEGGISSVGDSSVAASTSSPASPSTLSSRETANTTDLTDVESQVSVSAPASDPESKLETESLVPEIDDSDSEDSDIFVYISSLPTTSTSDVTDELDATSLASGTGCENVPSSSAPVATADSASTTTPTEPAPASTPEPTPVLAPAPIFAPESESKSEPKSKGLEASMHAPKGLEASMHAPKGLMASRYAPKGLDASMHDPKGLMASMHAPRNIVAPVNIGSSSSMSKPRGLEASMHAPRRETGVSGSNRTGSGLAASMHAPRDGTGTATVNGNDKGKGKAKAPAPVESDSESSDSDSESESEQETRGTEVSMHAPRYLRRQGSSVTSGVVPRGLEAGMHAPRPQPRFQLSAAAPAFVPVSVPALVAPVSAPVATPVPAPVPVPASDDVPTASGEPEPVRADDDKVPSSSTSSSAPTSSPAPKVAPTKPAKSAKRTKAAAPEAGPSEPIKLSRAQIRRRNRRDNQEIKKAAAEAEAREREREEREGGEKEEEEAEELGETPGASGSGSVTETADASATVTVVDADASTTTNAIADIKADADVVVKQD